MTTRIHCSYHKCLTVYYQRVMTELLKHFGGYKHFNSDLTAFLSKHNKYRVASVNNHPLDLERFGDFRITRFIRDPRDLIVSGYFYHRRGAEPWCLVENPTPADWTVVNGCLPRALQPGESFTSCLQRLDQEDGLIAEMEFRSHHFDSMRHWPDDPRIRTWQYEQILGNEEQVFDEVLLHYGFSWPFRTYGRRLARRFKASGSAARGAHIRDPRPGQWRDVFTDKVARAFEERYQNLPQSLGYN